MEKSARIDLKVLPAFDKCPNEGKDEQLRSLLQHSFDELKPRYYATAKRCDDARFFASRGLPAALISLFS